ncbi:MAG: tRNA (adenosine(37)-N6)-threonylcarbamoyltransferase complex dimerization subunit type 1 TsaB [Saprospiraceae bacterium]|nr:tRNA (adenosine(37)-N6)-threonylcarbamoyltransferase complex dimerization subunit type 1 TsaB [Saprospiraceae bacterium]
MALILLIETATANCSAALARDGVLLVERSSDDGYVHAELLAVFIQECLEEGKVKVADLDAIGVSIGPGSYTGLRVGLSTAKGLAYGLQIPILPIPTLEALTRAAEALHPGAQAYFSAIDARRAEVYLFRSGPEDRQGPSPVVLDTTPWTTWLETADGKVVVCGDGAPKVLEWWAIPGLVDGGIRCAARHLAGAAEDLFQQGNWADIAYLEPQYLKPPNVTIPKSPLIPGPS